MFKYITDVNFAESKEYKAALKSLDDLGAKLNIKTPAKDIVGELANSLKNGINAAQVTIYTDQINDGKMRDYRGAGGLEKMQKALLAGNANNETYTNPYDKSGKLVEKAKEAIIEAEQLSSGDIFYDSNGNKYKISKKKILGLPIGEKQAVLQSAMGGAVRKYGDGSMGGVWGSGTYNSDSIPAMLSNGEYVLNAAATQKFGIPLLDQMNGSYNIPSSTKSMGTNIINSPSSNNVYDINIVLNGTNVTAEDVIIQMKREMTLVNAKEGINRRV